MLKHFIKFFNESDKAIYYYAQGISDDKKPTPNDLYYLDAVNIFIQNKKFDNAKQALNIFLHFNPDNVEVKQQLMKLAV